MTRMMSAMEVKPTGDIDRDFVAMMAPHHQGGIDMAVLELRYGKNEQLRRLAQEIIVSQTQEIAAMKLAIGEQVTASAPAPTQAGRMPAHDHMNMSDRHEEIGTTDELFDLEKQPAGLHDRCHIDGSLDVACGGLGRPGPRRRGLPRHSDQPSRPRLRGGTVFEHGLGHRSRRQQAARRDPPRRSAARQFQPALQGTGAGPRHGLSRPTTRRSPSSRSDRIR